MRFEASEHARGDELARRVMSTLSAKWSLPILDTLARQPARYYELLHALPGVAPKVLTQSLRRLQNDGFVLCEVLDAGGRRYGLSAAGERMLHLVSPLRTETGRGARSVAD
jgi:DNA-binding HxlR family transcriptional regulator